jgi:hypothetical protein
LSAHQRVVSVNLTGQSRPGPREIFQNLGFGLALRQLRQATTFCWLVEAVLCAVHKAFLPTNISTRKIRFGHWHFFEWSRGPNVNPITKFRRTLQNETADVDVSPLVLPRSCTMSRSQRLAEPIVLPRCDKLVTLRDAIADLGQGQFPNPTTVWS